MNLFDAEKFFKKYHGLEFHMAREDEKLYDEFKKMDNVEKVIIAADIVGTNIP